MAWLGHGMARGLRVGQLRGDGMVLCQGDLTGQCTGYAGS